MMRVCGREELLPLLRLEGIGRIRARKLHNNKVKDVAVSLGLDRQLVKQVVLQELDVYSWE